MPSPILSRKCLRRILAALIIAAFGGCGGGGWSQVSYAPGASTGFYHPPTK